jgi:hypothetical protein
MNLKFGVALGSGDRVEREPTVENNSQVCRIGAMSTNDEALDKKNHAEGNTF